MPSPKSPQDNGQLAAQARADLAAGRWRKARDAFKELCKHDRSAFLPPLIEANVGLTRALLAKCQTAEARQVLAYLKTIAPPATVDALTREIADASNAPAVVPKQPQADPISLLAGDAGTPAERIRWADDLVVALTRPLGSPRQPSDARREQIEADLHAIDDALEAVCAGQIERAVDLVRPLRRDSSFAHWRLFIRGVVAYQSGEADKARRFFEEVPADSIPGRARQAWLLVLGDSPGASEAPATAVSEAVLEAAATMTGHTGWGHTLARADALWRGRKFRQAYRALRDGPAAFPVSTPDLAGALSDLYFNSALTLREEELEQFEIHLFELEDDRRV